MSATMNRWWCIWSNAWCGRWWAWGCEWWWSRLMSSESESRFFIRWSSLILPFRFIECVFTWEKQSDIERVFLLRCFRIKAIRTCLLRWSLRMKRFPQTWQANRFSPKHNHRWSLSHEWEFRLGAIGGRNLKEGRCIWLTCLLFVSFDWLIDVACRTSLLTYDHLSLPRWIDIYTHEWFIPHK